LKIHKFRFYIFKNLEWLNIYKIKIKIDCKFDSITKKLKLCFDFVWIIIKIVKSEIKKHKNFEQWIALDIRFTK